MNGFNKHIVTVSLVHFSNDMIWFKDAEISSPETGVPSLRRSSRLYAGSKTSASSKKPAASVKEDEEEELASVSISYEVSALRML